MAQQLKFLGVPVYMNGQNYYIPSLSTIDFRANYDTLTKPPTAEGDTEQIGETFDRILPIILLAIQRNYPEVTKENLAEWLDIHTFGLAIRAVQNASGMSPVSAGE